MNLFMEHTRSYNKVSECIISYYYYLSVSNGFVKSSLKYVVVFRGNDVEFGHRVVRDYEWCPKSWVVM